MKAVRRLGREGFLLNTRGRGGGLALAQPAREIRLGDVIRRVEGRAPVVDCRSRAIAPACRLATALADAMKAFEAVLDRHTLQDLVSNRRQLEVILRPLARAA